VQAIEKVKLNISSIAFGRRCWEKFRNVHDGNIYPLWVKVCRTNINKTK
jgi:hypothetical protein